MGKERRENNPARVAKIYQSAGFSFDHYGNTAMVEPGDYQLNDGRIVTAHEDEEAQDTFKKRGYNKGKAKDMAKNLSKNVEKSLPWRSPASENYDGAPYEQWKVTEPRGI